MSNSDRYRVFIDVPRVAANLTRANLDGATWTAIDVCGWLSQLGFQRERDGWVCTGLALKMLGSDEYSLLSDGNAARSPGRGQSPMPLRQPVRGPAVTHRIIIDLRKLAANLSDVNKDGQTWSEVDVCAWLSKNGFLHAQNLWICGEIGLKILHADEFITVGDDGAVEPCAIREAGDGEHTGAAVRSPDLH